MEGSLTVLVLTLLVSLNTALGQAATGPHPKKPRTPDDYKSRTLREMIAAPDDESRGNKLETMVVNAATLPSHVRVAYTGSSRPVPPIKKEVLRQWARLYAGMPEGYTEAYETEILFAENGAEFWLAIRKELIPRLRRDFERGESVDLYLIRVGSAKLPEGWESMLLVESVGQASDDRRVEEQIRELNDQEVQALLRNDLKTLAQLWSDDFVVTNPFNRLINKSQVLELTQSGALAFTSYERQIDYLRIHGETAFVAGSETVQWSGKMPTAGKTSRLRFTAVWMKRGEHWQEVLRHASMVETR